MAFSALAFFAITLLKPVEDRSHGCKLLYLTCTIQQALHFLQSLETPWVAAQLLVLVKADWSFAQSLCAADTTTLIVTIASVAYYAMVGLPAGSCFSTSSKHNI